MKSPKTVAEAEPIKPGQAAEPIQLDEAEPLTQDEATALLAPLRGKPVLLAVSGGADSMALLGLAAQVLSGPLWVASVDHGLRTGARAEAELVADFAARLGLPHKILDWYGDKPDSRIQEAARNARYELLLVHARQLGATHLVTAHHGDDQAETVLFRLLRGSGPGGLAGMRGERLRGGLVHARPLLAVPKARLLATCRAHGWPFAEDPSNRAEKFARVRIRRILAALEPEGLSREILAKLAQRSAKIEDALAAQTEVLWRAHLIEASSGARIFSADLLSESPALIERVVQRVLGELHETGWPRLERIESAVAKLCEAHRAPAPCRRSLGACLLIFDGKAQLELRLAPLRQRGKAPSGTSL